MEVKKQLGMYIVERFHSKEDAINAREHFEKVHSKKKFRKIFQCLKYLKLALKQSFLK